MDGVAERRALTGLRGAAALHVALYHVFRSVYGDAPSLGVPLLGGVVLRGYLAVDLFFVLSGFVMAMAYADWFTGRWSARTYLAFVARRIARLWPLHAAVLCAMLAADALSGAWWVWPRMIAANALLVQAWGLSVSLNVPSWSISTEFAAYLLFPVLLAAAHRGGPIPPGDEHPPAPAAAPPPRGRDAPGATRRARPSAGAAGVLRAATLLAAAGTLAAVVWFAPAGGAERHGQLDIYANYSVLPLLRCLAGFTIGIVAHGVAGAWPARPWCAAGASAALLAGLAAGLDDLVLYPLLPVLVASLAPGGGGVARLLAGAPLHWLGRVSYALYLVHVPVLDAAKAAFGAHWPALRAGWPGATLAGLLALSLGVAWLAHRAVEVPGRHGLRALAGRVGLGRARVRAAGGAGA